MNGKWILRLELDNQLGESYTRTIELDRDCIFSGMDWRTMETIEMAADAGVSAPGLDFDSVAEMVQKKEFRRGLLISECRRIGGMLANHMEDKEGWHGLDRQESAQNRT